MRRTNLMGIIRKDVKVYFGTDQTGIILICPDIHQLCFNYPDIHQFIFSAFHFVSMLYIIKVKEN